MLAEFAGWLSLVTGSLGKVGRDIALLAPNEIADVTVTGAAWTLKWMLLPQMVVATGAALARGLTLLDALRINNKH